MLNGLHKLPGSGAAFAGIDLIASAVDTAPSLICRLSPDTPALWGNSDYRRAAHTNAPNYAAILRHEQLR